MSELENKQELREKLLSAKDIEEVRAILSPETAEEEIKQVWREIEAHRPAEGLEAVDDDELEAVSGGADRDWEKEGCSATVEKGSWCGSDDDCIWWDVTYTNFDPCSEGGKHEWQHKLTGFEGRRYMGRAKYYLYECKKCKKTKKRYDE
ncbi:MAG: hypothetical protein Q4G00_05935 [Clostridia bacterium]|nr:hypothetical protein [Clostridia bacterium]